MTVGGADSRRPARVVVLGGGIAGLTSAYRLRKQLGDAAEVVLVEAADRLGGKLYTEQFAGGPVEFGAEAFIVRRPEVRELLAELDLTGEIVSPGSLGSRIWSQGALHPMPKRTLMGVPSDGASVAGLVDEATVARIDAEPTTPLHWTPGSDTTVAELVGGRFGEQVIRRCVDPMLGGVYSGLSDSIGVRAALPALAATLDAGAPSLTEAVRRALPKPPPAGATGGPVFGTLRGGYRVLLEALDRAARPVHLRATATLIAPGTDRRYSVVATGDAIGEADAVVVALPANAAATVLAQVAPDAAAAAAEIPLASSAVVGLALPEDVGLPEITGILVATDSPLGPGATAKAFTLSTRKWPHLAERGLSLVRVSYGRYGDAAIVDAEDATLVAAARRDLQAVSGVTAEPIDTRVQRWHGGLPQYLPGHLEVVQRLRAGLDAAEGVGVAGAMLDGVGVPAVLDSAAEAVDRVVAAIGTAP